jgi:hypothetical protein
MPLTPNDISMNSKVTMKQTHRFLSVILFEDQTVFVMLNTLLLDEIESG